MNNDLDLKILKAILSDYKLASDFFSECKSDLFNPEYIAFSEVIRQCISVYRNVPTLRLIIEHSKGKYNTDKFKEIFEKVEKTDYDTKEFYHDINEFKNRFAKTTISCLTEILNDKQRTNDIPKTIQTIQTTLQSVKSLYQAKAYEKKTAKEALHDYRQTYIAKKTNPTFGQGTLTGYSFLDFTLNGLRPTEMLIVGGESGGGKSLVLMNLAVQMWVQNNNFTVSDSYEKGCNVLYFSLEMPYNDCYERFLARSAMINQKKLRNASLDKFEESKLSKTAKFIEHYPYEFEIVDIPRGATVDNIELILNNTKPKYKPDVIVVDYLQLMTHNSNEDDWLKLGHIAEGLHELARVHNIIMLTAVQLNRESNKGKNSPESSIGMHRIGRSSLIMHNANFGIQIESRTDEQKHPDMRLHLIKSRRTELAKGILHKDLNCCALLDDPTMASNNLNPDDISEILESFS